MNDPHVAIVDDDVDDVCSCDSLYHSIIDTPDDAALPPVTTSAVPSNSPPPASFSTPELDSQSSKAQRSHERDRQRLKKPGDISKAKRSGLRYQKSKPERPIGNAGRPKQDDRVLRASFTEAERERKAELSASVELTGDGRGIGAPPVQTVALADLVKPARKGSDKQFEMIGRPRQVLVLDEFTEVGSKYDLDDWEYVKSEAKNRKAMVEANALSYARAVASGHNVV